MVPRVLLCIDDRPQVLQLRHDALVPHGYSVLGATTNRSAIEILEHTTVAAVLLEYKREGIDAEAVAYHIKQRFPNQPVVLLSAYSDIPERILWLVDDYVMKSEPLEVLIRRLERLTPRASTNHVRKSAAGCSKLSGKERTA